MRFSRTIAFTAVMLAGAMPVLAADGVLVVQRVTSGGSATTNEIQVTPDRMRARMTGPSGERQSMIFDGPKQTLSIIDDGKKSYTEITKAEVEKLGAQMKEAMAMMEKQLAGMPPGMREQMEKVMAGRGMGALAPVRTDYKPAGTGTVGRWTCSRFDGFQSGKKTSEICTVSPDALGFTEADFAVTRQMADFLRALVPQGLEQFFGVNDESEQGFSGIPVRQVTSIGGREETIELTEARRESFDDAVFTVPSGYRRQAFAPGR